MLAKKTAKNQITLPKAVIKDFPDTEYYAVRCEGDLIVLEPVRLEKRTEGRQSRADKVRERLADLGITEQDVHEAVIELIRVLGYPKFELSEEERLDLMADYLPFAEAVEVEAADLADTVCRDADDQTVSRRTGRRAWSHAGVWDGS